MFEALFGTEMPLALRFFIAFLFVLGLIGGAAYLVRRFGSGALGSAASRGRQPRLAVIDAAPVDGRRRLVLIRRDNVEHLLMIGGPSDIVVEPNIVRAAPASAGRDAPAPRASGDTLSRAVPLSEGTMWPLQPEPMARQTRPAPEEPVWPREAPPEPVVPAARVSGGDRLAGLAADLSRAASAPAPEHAPPSVRPAPIESRRPAPVAAAPAPAPAPASQDDQNLAEMAHRLEAALRRPTQSETIPVEAPMTRSMAEPMDRSAPPPPEPPAPPPGPRPAVGAIPDIARMTVDPKAPPRAAPRPEQKQGTKSVYDSLEQEMASLLGRPSGKT